MSSILETSHSNEVFSINAYNIFFKKSKFGCGGNQNHNVTDNIINILLMLIFNKIITVANLKYMLRLHLLLNIQLISLLQISFFRKMSSIN